jgi:tetratricopeptide (TPR) repeat protein
VSTDLLIKEGLDQCRQALAIQRRLQREHPDVVRSLTELGRMLDEAGEPATAVEALREALQMAIEVCGNDHAQTQRARHRLGVVLGPTQPAEAVEFLSQVMDHERHRRATQPRELVVIARDRGQVWLRMGKFAAAEQDLTMALEQVEDGGGADPVLHRSVLEAHVQLYDRWERPQQAERFREKLRALGS